MKKIFLILVTFFSCYIGQAQKAQAGEEPIYKDFAFQNFKYQFSIYYTSDIYFQYEKVTTDFYRNTNHSYSFTSSEPFEEWVTKNLDKTQFKSVEEAVEAKRVYDDTVGVNRITQEYLNSQQRGLGEKYGVEYVENIVRQLYDEIKDKQIEQIKKWGI